MSTEFRIVVPSGGQTRERAREEGSGYAKGTGSFEACKFEGGLLAAHLMLQKHTHRFLRILL